MDKLKIIEITDEKYKEMISFDYDDEDKENFDTVNVIKEIEDEEKREN